MIRKEVLRPGAKRNPLVPAFARIAAVRTLVNKDGLNGEPVVCLNQHVFCDSKSLRVLDKRSWVFYRGAEVARGSLSVLDRKPVVATFPFQALMSNPKCESTA